MIVLSPTFKVTLSSPLMAARLIPVSGCNALFSDVSAVSITSGISGVVVSPVGSAVNSVTGSAVDSVTGSVVEPVVVSSAVSELPPSTDVSSEFDRAVGVGATVAVTSGSASDSAAGSELISSTVTGVSVNSSSPAKAEILLHNTITMQSTAAIILFFLLLFMAFSPPFTFFIVDIVSLDNLFLNL